MKIALGTTSELKLRAAHNALSKLSISAELIPSPVDSGIPDQPYGLEEITQGASNRARSALNRENADLGVGIENGVMKVAGFNRWVEIPVVVVAAPDGSESFAYGAAYPLPDWAVEDMQRNNSELGVFVRTIDPSAEKDPINYFSSGAVKRDEMLTEAIVCALIEYLRRERFIKPKEI